MATRVQPAASRAAIVGEEALQEFRGIEADYGDLCNRPTFPTARVANLDLELVDPCLAIRDRLDLTVDRVRLLREGLETAAVGTGLAEGRLWGGDVAEQERGRSPSPAEEQGDDA